MLASESALVSTDTPVRPWRSDASVTFSNIRFGPIGSTTPDPQLSDPAAPSPPPAPTPDQSLPPSSLSPPPPSPSPTRSPTSSLSPPPLSAAPPPPDCVALHGDCTN